MPSEKKKISIRVREATRKDIPGLIELNKAAYPQLAEENVVWGEVHLLSHQRVDGVVALGSVQDHAGAAALHFIEDALVGHQLPFWKYSRVPWDSIASAMRRIATV